MTTLSLQIRDGHMFVQVGSDLFLLDTGAPNSFAASPILNLAGQTFSLRSSYLGLTSETLSRFVGVGTVGLIGADVLNSFDLIIDAPQNTIMFSTGTLACDGDTIPLDEFMGIPIVSTQIGGATYRTFFDTGAQISYLQDDSLAAFPPAGRVTDFFPGIGEFQTDTHTVEIRVGVNRFSLRCGSLPSLLGMTLLMAGTQGILGNQVLQGRTVGYFPRRKTLVL